MKLPPTVKRFLQFAGLLLLLGLLAWGWTPNRIQSPGCARPRNAAWISVDWTAKPVDAEAVKRLATSAQQRNLRYLFPYASYLREDGSFSPSYTHAADFVKVYRRVDDRARLLAWVGIPLRNDRALGVKGWVDLSRAETRRQISEFAGDLVARGGFDGLHLNAETVPNQDPHFLSLLEELRRAIGPGNLLSIAGSHWVPDLVNRLPFIRGLRWTSDYYREVGQRVNQVATMTYDSHAFHPALYRLWMREEVRGLQRSLDGLGLELLIGISVSRESTGSHRVGVEGLRSGLAGLCAGLDSGAEVNGVGLYADWDFNEADHQVWQQWQSMRLP